MKDIVKLLRKEGTLDDEGMKTLLRTEDEAVLTALYAAARETREAVYGKKVYIRGLIEISSHCKNNCYYCGAFVSICIYF